MACSRPPQVEGDRLAHPRLLRFEPQRQGDLHRHLGWYDSNPTHLAAAPADRHVDFMGGAMPSLPRPASATATATSAESPR